MRKMSHRREHKKVGLFKLLGLGVGLYSGLTAYGNPSDPMSIVQDPHGSMNRLILSVTGYNPEVNYWSLQNASFFWLPVLTFFGIDWLGRKLLHSNVKLTKELSLF